MLFLACSGAGADETQLDLRDLLVRTHRASVQALRTVKCKLAVEAGNGTNSRAHYVRGQYWRSGNDFRIREEYPDGRILESAVCRGNFLSFGRSKQGTGAAKGNPQDFSSICDVWSQMLLSFPGKRSLEGTLEEFLQLAGSTIDLRRANQGGHACIVLTATLKNDRVLADRLEYWFDEGVNLLVRKLNRSWEAKGGKGRAVFEVDRFVETEPGLFFPVQSRVEGFGSDGAIDSSMVCKVSELEVNRPVPPGVFELAVPAGTLMTDRTRDVSYQVDAAGNQVGPASAILPARREMMASSATVRVGGQTQGEPWAWWQWLLTLSASVFALSGIAFIVRRKRASKEV